MQVPAIDQRFVEVQAFPGAVEGGYDACWDVLAVPEGRVYAGCGCEDGNCLPVRLYAYDIPTKKMIFLFDAADVTHTPPGAIPQSKVHTSMARMEDGRLIMCTHSTARAEGHPFWAINPCYQDLYEGYPGSHVIIYDPKTNRAEDCGIPAPRESTMGGGVYIPGVRQYFMLGYLRGHLHAFHVDTGKTRDLGYVGLGAHLFSDPRGCVYGIGPTGKGGRGRCYRYDPRRDVLEDLELSIPGDPYAGLSGNTSGPDGKIYFLRHYFDHIMTFDPETQRIEDLGAGFPDANRYACDFNSWKGNPETCIYGLKFLADGKLYYTVTYGSITEIVALMRRDVIGGGRPEFLGFIYGDNMASFIVCAMDRGADGRLYMASHQVNGCPPRLVIVDAVKLSAPGPQARMIPRRWSSDAWLAQMDRNINLVARSGTPSVKNTPDHFRTVELYDALLPAWDCAVRGMGCDTEGRLHIGMAGGAVVVWNGHDASILYKHPEKLLAFAAGPEQTCLADSKTIWTYDPRIPDPKPRVVATIPDGCQIACLRISGDQMYGLLEPGFRPFLVRDKLWVGKNTGGLVPGYRTLVRGPDGLYYGARDEGFVFSFREDSGEIVNRDFRLPSLKGREFLTRWTAAVVLGPHIYGGTGDGYLFRFDPVTGTIHNFGKPDLSLGIVDLAVAGEQIIGISGRGPLDLCRLFAYSPSTGFESLGCLPISRFVFPPFGLSCIAALPDGWVAVAAAERISHVFLIRR